MSAETVFVKVNANSTVCQPIALDIEERGEYKLIVSIYKDGDAAVSYKKYLYVSESAQRYSNIGVCTHFDYDTFYGLNDMTVLKNTGFSMIRDECRWQNVEKKKGVLYLPTHVWEYVDEAEKTVC